MDNHSAVVPRSHPTRYLSERVEVRVDPELRAALVTEAHRRGVTTGAVLRDLAREAFGVADRSHLWPRPDTRKAAE